MRDNSCLALDNPNGGGGTLTQTNLIVRVKMKKIAILLIALVLICSSAFATFSVSGGFGLERISNLWGGTKYTQGPAAFFGVEYKLNNGLFVYNETEFSLAVKNQDGKFETGANFDSVIYDKTGVAYTYKDGNLFGMAGIGPSVQIHRENGLNVFTFGVNALFKGTVSYSEHCGFSLQFNPSIDFLSFGANAGKESTLSLPVFAGITVTY